MIQLDSNVLTALLSNASLHIFVIDTNIVVQQWNIGMEKSFSIAYEHAFDKSLLEIFPNLSPYKTQIIECEHCNFKNVKYLNIEDQRVIVFNVEFSSIFHKSKKVGFVGIIELFQENDYWISEIEHIQLDVREIFNAFPDLLFRVNSEGIYSDFKVSNIPDLLLNDDLLVGEHISDLLPTEIANKTLFFIRRALRYRTIQHYKYSFSNLQNKQKFFESRISPINTHEVLIIVRGISQSEFHSI